MNIRGHSQDNVLVNILDRSIGIKISFSLEERVRGATFLNTCQMYLAIGQLRRKANLSTKKIKKPLKN